MLTTPVMPPENRAPLTAVMLLTVPIYLSEDGCMTSRTACSPELRTSLSLSDSGQARPGGVPYLSQGPVFSFLSSGDKSRDIETYACTLSGENRSRIDIDIDIIFLSYSQMLTAIQNDPWLLFELILPSDSWWFLPGAHVATKARRNAVAISERASHMVVSSRSLPQPRSIVRGRCESAVEKARSDVRTAPSSPSHEPIVILRSGHKVVNTYGQQLLG